MGFSIADGLAQAEEVEKLKAKNKTLQVPG